MDGSQFHFLEDGDTIVTGECGRDFQTKLRSFQSPKPFSKTSTSLSLPTRTSTRLCSSCTRYASSRRLNFWVQTCDAGLTSIRALSEGVRKPSAYQAHLVQRLCFERDIYKLLLDLCKGDRDAEQLPVRFSTHTLSLQETGSLSKLLRNNQLFRKLHILLLWTESRSADLLQGFTACLADQTINPEKIWCVL